MNGFYPISLNLEGRLCLVIGGGNVAYRKVQGLLKCKALVKVISPEVESKLQSLLVNHTSITWIKNIYTGPPDLQGAILVFAATNNPALNRQICQDAKSIGALVNMASDSHLGDFIMPASFSKGDLQVTVSTSGKIPGLSKYIKENLEDQFTNEYELLIEILERIRQVAILENDYKKENLLILNHIIQDYPLILQSLNQGIPKDVITNKLLNKLKPGLK